jgi:sigma-B regulation protein RsbQ
MQTDPQVVSDMRVREAEVPDREEYLTRITVPTLILQSGSGRHQGREQGKFIHDRVPNSQLFHFEGRGHGFFMSAPDEFWGRVEDFLAELRTKS